MSYLNILPKNTKIFFMWLVGTTLRPIVSDTELDSEMSEIGDID